MMKISHSVGRGGRNIDKDVRVVQTLLNRHIVSPAKLLVVDGIVGSKTIGAIEKFQHRLGMHKCDGRVDPSGKTFNALLSAPKSVPITIGLPFSFETTYKSISKYITHNIPEIFSRPTSGSSSTSSNTQPNRIPPPVLTSGNNAIAWGAKVSPEFKKRVVEICAELEMSPDYLMTCMAFETGESFRSDQPNLAGGGAIGLIQFTKPAIDELNRKYSINPPLTRRRLAEMTNVEQLEYVRLHFLGYKGKLNSMEDTYMVILAPAAVGRGPDGNVYRKDDKKHPEYYEKNEGLDKQPRDGVITLKECSVVLKAKYLKGLSKGYFG